MMTDLLTRIRAYVAQIPTHECAYCHADWAAENQDDLACKNCGHRFWVAKEICPPDALLREVAALEPVASIGPLGIDTLSRLNDAVVFPPEFGIKGDSLLYTLTGDSHDTE